MFQQENKEVKDIQKLIDERVNILVPQILKSRGFTDRKLTDTPTDSLQVVNRAYVTNNGTTANRPKSSVLGQPYFDTSLGNGKPVWWNGTGFVDATGTYV